MLLKNKKVAIIGAGPVGLTIAKLLQQEDANVTVYERDENAQARIWGGPLDLHEGSGQEAMQKAGLLRDYFTIGIPMGRTIANEQGKALFSAGPQYDTPEINRNDLRQLLLNNLTNITVVWDRKLTGLSEHDGKWILKFENKPDAIADVVIGANGGMSSVRKYVTNAEIEYTGTYIIQSEVSEPETKCPEFFNLCNGNILMVANQGINLVANPKNNGRLTYNITFRKPEKWISETGLNFQDPENITAFLLDMFADWHEYYKQLFKATSFFTGIPARKISLDKPWKNNRPLPITLIGDAAHIMPPFAGKGVNTGLTDALILSENLTSSKFTSIAEAISNYEQRMFIYAKQAQLETSQNEIAMHQPGFSFQKRFSN